MFMLMIYVLCCETCVCVVLNSPSKLFIETLVKTLHLKSLHLTPFEISPFEISPFEISPFTPLIDRNYDLKCFRVHLNPNYLPANELQNIVNYNIGSLFTNFSYHFINHSIKTETLLELLKLSIKLFQLKLPIKTPY